VTVETFQLISECVSSERCRLNTSSDATFKFPEYIGCSERRLIGY
jgi:hypothetical protein